MWNLPKKLVDAVADVTVGTAIVMVHAVLAERQRPHRLPPVRRDGPIVLGYRA
jgi:hypothetical protein